MNVADIALQGIQQAFAGAQTAARRISQSTDASAGGDVVDLSAEMVALMQAKSLNGAMVAVAQTADEMDGHILNLLA